METNPAISMERQSEPKSRSLYIDLFLRLVKEKPLGLFGLILMLALIFIGIFANVVAPYPLGEMDLTQRLQPPSAAHLLGTNHLGEDVLSNIIYGARVSVIIGFSATALMTVVSLIIGGLSGFLGGILDMVIQRVVDAWISIPGMLILLTMMSIMGPGVLQIIIAIGVPMGISGSRIIRGAVIAIRDNPYVDAARVAGTSTKNIMIRHILPNIMPIIIISFTLHIGGVILMESSLSFLGFGVPPGVPSWGSMLSQEGRQYMLISPSLSIWPGLALALTVYAANMFGDAIRDLLDPRLKGGLGRYNNTKKKIRVKLNKPNTVN
jgi:peptide/nickel transport system permease protein